MVKFKTSSILPIVCAALSLFVGVDSNPYLISDQRVRRLDITPVLGRGYSIMTNSYQSTCLTVESTTTPSYNYDYYFTDLTSESTRESLSTSKVSSSFGFGAINLEASREMSQTSKIKLKTHIVAATMRLERYYSSVKEHLSPLANDAAALLDAQDYVGFFKACGPNYVRGIRRAQELSAIFKFASTSISTASQFAAGISGSAEFGFLSVGVGAKASGSSKFNSASSSLQIKIKGFGLGLNQEGSDSLVATTMEDYQSVLTFAFTSATQNEDSHNIGMVYGIEVVPWVNNLSFQVNAKVLDEVIVINLPRSMIPMAHQIADGTTEFEIGQTRDDYQCKDPTFVFDKFGYCCETQWLWDQTTLTYDPSLDVAAAESTAVCKPQRDLDKSLVKENMSNNGEFVARLDAAMRYRVVQMSTVESCISSARAHPVRYDNNILKTKDSVKYDRAIPRHSITLSQLKRTLDPLGDYGLIMHLSRELDEWIKMFYTPCIAALYGTNLGSHPSVDESFFMAYPWYVHDECMHLSCLSNSMRWDRENGGCVTGIMTGTGASEYSAETEPAPYCASDLESTEESETCIYSKALLESTRSDYSTCWTATLSNHNPSYMIDNFCMPVLTGDTISQQEIDEFAQNVANNCTPSR